MSCSYYTFRQGDYYCTKKGDYVNSDVYYKYCRNYDYSDCPIYKGDSSGGCYLTSACIEEARKDMNALMCIACYNTEKLIYEFLKNGFIVRGAITYGDIYFENERNVWFGPAMNRAFYLESKIAKFPRIIIDPEYARGLVSYNEQKYRSSTIQQKMNGEIISKDADDLYYLNCFNSISYMNDAEETATWC